MKEATGELSTTVITIVAIAAIIGIFTVFLLPTLQAQIALTQACNNGPGYTATSGGGTVICSAAGTTDAPDCTEGEVGGTKACDPDNQNYTCTYCRVD